MLPSLNKVYYYHYHYYYYYCYYYYYIINDVDGEDDYCGDNDNMKNFLTVTNLILRTLNPSTVSWLWPAKFKLSSL